MNLNLNRDIIAQITELAKVLKEQNLTELEFQSGDSKIVLCNHNQSKSVAHQTFQSEPVEHESTPKSKIETKDDNLINIKSPMVGTLYISPSPEKPAFIQKGATVKKGDVLFIVEAMKVMNEVKSTCSGIVDEILVTNQCSVEFDQVLARVKPNENQ
ncbi:MAG: acetyl-CoA carboxylase, biotin carboxyl carrier protein [Alphaproteobacteria bacterium]|nr:MAG: acetyl-CoA carboxylase, biotin carboxyl carrier protein [Alphaproteobacteria bacterium]